MYMNEGEPSLPSRVRRLLRGDENRITWVLPSDEIFAESAFCNDVDGELDFPEDGLYGYTAQASSNRQNNEDGILLDTMTRAIIGADGMGHPPHGEIASALAIASVYQDTRQGVPLADIAERACAFLQREFAQRSIPQDPLNPSGTTLGYAREAIGKDGKKVEGWIVGDYTAMVIDITDRRIVYESCPQNLRAEVNAREGDHIVLAAMYADILTNSINAAEGLSKPPVYFHYDIPAGHTVVTLLYSDGVSNKVVSIEILETVLRCAREGRFTQAGRKIIDRVLTRRTRDNVSLVCMVSSGTTDNIIVATMIS